jgi:hypothetical protein
MPDKRTLGARFVRALADKDRDELSALLAPQIDFRGLTPSRVWEAGDADAVLSTLFDSWFEAGDEIEQLQRLETDAFADRERVGYRLAVSNPEGRLVVEQQAYLSGEDDRIKWMRVLCSGFRAAD